jgi:hypothetical protein
MIYSTIKKRPDQHRDVFWTYSATRLSAEWSVLAVAIAALKAILFSRVRPKRKLRDLRATFCAYLFYIVEGALALLEATTGISLFVHYITNCCYKRPMSPKGRNSKHGHTPLTLKFTL